MSDSNEHGADEAPPSDDDDGMLPPETVKVQAVRIPPVTSSNPVPPNAVTSGTAPMQPIPAEVHAHIAAARAAVGQPGGPATPFEVHRPVVPSALPFQSPAAGGGGADIGPTPGAVAASAGPPPNPVVVLRRKQPPPQLASPGLLGGAASFHAHAHLIGAAVARAPRRLTPLAVPVAATVSPAGESPAGGSPAGVSPAGVSPAGVSPAGVPPTG
ncbi:MAG: hypothetical protein AAF928_17570, partial [Myxococcota bacterium]